MFFLTNCIATAYKSWTKLVLKDSAGGNSSAIFLHLLKLFIGCMQIFSMYFEVQDIVPKYRNFLIYLNA